MNQKHLDSTGRGESQRTTKSREVNVVEEENGASLKPWRFQEVTNHVKCHQWVKEDGEC